jgi:2'-5' RNA ligase
MSSSSSSIISDKKKCIWFEFELPKKIKDEIHLWRSVYLNKYFKKEKPWKKDRLHTTFMYCGDDFEYTVDELKKILDTVDYTPTVKFSDFKRGDWSPVYFLTLDEVNKSSKNNHHQSFKKAYQIATSNNRKIGMHGHNKGQKHPGLHITIFWAQKNEKIDSNVIKKAKTEFFKNLKEKKLESFQFSSIRVMSENSRTKEDYVVFEKKFY